jgi:hypothetical protein
MLSRDSLTLRHPAVLFAGLIFITNAVQCQTSTENVAQRAVSKDLTSDSPGFEAITIRPASPSGGLLGFSAYPDGRIFVGETTVKTLIQEAFDVEEAEIMGGPAWASTERNDVETKSVAPRWSQDGAPWPPKTDRTAPNREEREMLRALLANSLASDSIKRRCKDKSGCSPGARGHYNYTPQRI